MQSSYTLSEIAELQESEPPGGSKKAVTQSLIRKVANRLGLSPDWRSILFTGSAIVAIFAGGVAAAAGLKPAQLSRITLDPGTRFQTIDSWDVYPRYWEHDKVNNRFDNSYAVHADDISRYLVNEVGISGARVEIWSGLENPTDNWSLFFSGKRTYEEDKPYRYQKINDNDDPFSINRAGFQVSKFDHRVKTMVLPLKRAMETKGERLRVNVNYVDFAYKAKPSSLSHAENPEEYAEIILFYFNRLREEFGIVPDSLEIVLEPENTDDWRGREIGRAILAVKARLNSAGFDPEIVAPSTAFMPSASEYFDQMAEVPGAIDALGTFAYHRYGTTSVAYVQQILERATRHGLKTAMLEKVGAEIDQLLEDLIVGQVSSWQQWALAGLAEWDDEGAFYLNVDMRDRANPRIMMARNTYHLTQVFRHVRAGAVRIGAESDNADRTPVAFINSNGSWAVVVRAKEAGGPLKIESLPAGRYRLRYISEENEIEEWPPATVTADGPLEFELPGPGTISIVTDK